MAFFTAQRYENLKTDMPVSPAYRSYVKPLLEGKKILDLGCAVGRYLEIFSKHSIGIDYSEENLKECRQKRLHVVKGDLNRTFPVDDESFEAVFASHVIEHVDAPIHFLRECYRVMKPKGILVIAVPLEHAFIRFIDHYFDKHDGHLYAFSFDNMKVLFKKTGFEYERLFLDAPLVGRFPFLSPFLHTINTSPVLLSWFAHSYFMIGKKTSLDNI